MDILEFTSPEAEKIVTEGYVLALPTETVYGVGVRWDDEKAYERLCACKRRRPDKAIAVMASDTFDLSPYFEITPAISRVMKAFLPGPLTVLVKAKKSAPYQTHLGTGIAGIRIPGKPELLAFLSLLPFPLQVTSANISGEPATSSFEEVRKTFEGSEEVKGIVKGTCVSSVPTTVVNLTGEKPIVIREGEVKLAEIEKAFYGKE
jgi:L-threonylcarbamoyladenylate synthase